LVFSKLLLFLRHLQFCFQVLVGGA
jgi:hypothetical protein